MKFQALLFSLSTLFKLANSLVSVIPNILIEGAVTEVEFTFNSTQNEGAFNRVLIFPDHAFRSEGGKHVVKPREGWQIEEVFGSDGTYYVTPKVIHTYNEVYHEAFMVEVSVPLNYSGSVAFHALYQTKDGRWSNSDIKSPGTEISVISQQQLLYEHKLVSELNDTISNAASIKSPQSGLIPVITQSDISNGYGLNPVNSESNSTAKPNNDTGLGLVPSQLTTNPEHASVVVVVVVQNIHLHHNTDVLNFANANQTLSDIIEESSNLNSNNTITKRS